MKIQGRKSELWLPVEIIIFSLGNYTHFTTFHPDFLASTKVSQRISMCLICSDMAQKAWQTFSKIHTLSALMCLL